MFAIDPYDSGGALSPEQATFDVTYYDLSVRVDPSDSSIVGTLAADLLFVHPSSVATLDLDPILEITGVELSDENGSSPADFERDGGRVRISLRDTRQSGERARVTVSYGGKPHPARRAPWDGGFTWSETPSGSPWIATSCQGEGADIWWPVKDHVSDEPDSMRIRVTVPAGLVAASNGRLEDTTVEADGWQTYKWFVSTPINTYNVALNIAPYEVIEGSLVSVAGDEFPVVFYVLPEHAEQGRALFPEILDHLRFFEEMLGPYPFRADKYGVAETPFLGMEHQSIIAYGANFDNGAMTAGRDWGFDALHHHELSHEWWGNMVTNADWSDMWLHEGFGSYMQALYMERLEGKAGYHAYMASIRRNITNERPVAPAAPVTADGIYGGDIYFKGAWILHSLRYLIGDEAFFQLLRRMSYPTKAMELVTDGGQCRFVTTEDFIRLAEEIADTNLRWFFDAYLRSAETPRLVETKVEGGIALSWQVPDQKPFPMPVPVVITSDTVSSMASSMAPDTVRVVVSAEAVAISVPAGSRADVDPDDWVLR